MHKTSSKLLYVNFANQGAVLPVKYVASSVGQAISRGFVNVYTAGSQFCGSNTCFIQAQGYFRVL